MEHAGELSDAKVGYPLMVCDPCPLPQFWQQQPEARFLNVKAQFTFAKIHSQQTRFYCLVTVLPRETALELERPLQSAKQSPVRRLQNSRPGTPESSAQCINCRDHI